METKKIRWAVCGLGRISKRFVKVVQSLVQNAEVVACVSSSKERALKYQQKFGLKHAFTYQELADNPTAVDAVYVCSNINVHIKNVQMFLNAKIPVLCEKPFSFNHATAVKMVEYAKESKTLLMEAMWTRFLPATKYVVETAESKALGNIRSLTGWFWAGIGHGPNSRVFKKETCGGSVLDLAVYLTHYSLMLLGVPEKITAEGQVINGVDRYCNFRFDYPDGAKASLSSSFKLLAIKEGFTINCEKGKIFIPRFFDAKRVVVTTADNKKIVKHFKKIDGFSYEIEHFGDLVRSGKTESPVMTFDRTLNVMKILEELNSQLGVTF